MTPDTATIARLFGCTPEQVRAQFAANSKQLSAMADKAQRTTRKVNGYTAQQLRAMACQAATKAGV